MSKVILKGFIIVPDSDLEIVKSELVVHAELTRNELGCLVFEVVQDTVNSNKFFVYEEFCDQEAFDHHQRRVKNSNWGQVTINVKRYYNISDSSYDL